MMRETVSIVEAKTPAQFAQGLRLIQAYLVYLDEDVSFQNTEAELNDLAKQYGPPLGKLLLAVVAGQPVGCVAYKTIASGVAEMKRLFVLPAFHGQNIGLSLANAIVAEAQISGFHTMVLDTVERLESALYLYKKLGFLPCKPYYHNPLPQVIYLSKAL